MFDRISEKEKKYSRALILVAGAICGLAVCISVLMTFAAAGAFVNGAEENDFRKPKYTVDTDSIPTGPVLDSDIPSFDNNGFKLTCNSCNFNESSKKLEYVLFYRCDSSEKVRITGIYCSLYKGTVCKSTTLLTKARFPGEEGDWWLRGSDTYSGSLEMTDTDCDAAVFSLTWENEAGEGFSTNVIGWKKG